MKVRVSEDEWFPFYYVTEDDGKPSYFDTVLEVPEATYREWEVARVLIQNVNDEIGDLYDAAKKKQRQEKLLEASKEKAKNDGLSSNF